jgi:hypothetical protein
MSGAPFKVNRGYITALRLFDIAFEIDLKRAETLSREAASAGARRKLTATPPHAVAFDDPPFGLALPARDIMLGGVPVRAGITARLYAFGVVTLAVSVAADNLAWDDYASRVNAVQAEIGPGSLNPIWDELVRALLLSLGPAMIRPSLHPLAEDFLIATVHEFDRPVLGSAFGGTDGAEIDLVRLLSGETRALSDSARADLLSRRFSYYADDLVVLTWDRAFIYEPRQDTDVADVIEVANAQFLELRYYDELLDDELPRMYDLVEATRRFSAGPRRFSKLARGLYALVAEVTELTEKVDNALQVTEDVYLARVYTAALELFKVKPMSAAVDRKLAIIRDTYTALYDEAAGARSGIMEMMIILLIMVEIGLAVLRAH